MHDRTWMRSSNARSDNRKSKIRNLKFVVLFGGMLLALSFPAQAQQAKKAPSIGYLSTGSPSSSTQTIEAFRQGLHELGYAEGKNITIEYRFAKGREDRIRQFASELVHLKVDVIFISSTAATLATKNATTTIPVVFTLVDDPVAFGLIDSLGRPGGNITGLTSGAGPGLYGKRLELLKETFPRVSRVAVLWNPDDPGSVINMRGMEAPARSLSLKLQSVEMREPNDLEQAFSAMRENMLRHWSRYSALWWVVSEAGSWTLRQRVGWQQCPRRADGQRPAASCPMERAIPIYTGVPPLTSIKSSKEQSPPIFPWSSR